MKYSTLVAVTLLFFFQLVNAEEAQGVCTIDINQGENIYYFVTGKTKRECKSIWFGMRYELSCDKTEQFLCNYTLKGCSQPDNFEKLCLAYDGDVVLRVIKPKTAGAQTI